MSDEEKSARDAKILGAVTVLLAIGAGIFFIGGNKKKSKA